MPEPQEYEERYDDADGLSGGGAADMYGEDDTYQDIDEGGGAPPSKAAAAPANPSCTTATSRCVWRRRGRCWYVDKKTPPLHLQYLVNSKTVMCVCVGGWPATAAILRLT